MSEIKYTIEMRGSRCFISPKPHYQLNSALNVKLSYEQKNAYFIKKNIENSGYDGIVRLYNVNSASFPIGLLDRVLLILKEFNINDVEVMDFRTTYQAAENMFLPFLSTRLRDYQSEAAEVALKKRVGMLHIATGGGKTILAAEIIRKLKLKTLFIVHTQGLLTQTKKVFEQELKIPVGIIRGPVAEFEKQIVIAMVQTLHRNLKKHQQQLSQFNILMIDEAHHASAMMIFKVAMMCPNAVYRLGFTGTPHRDDGHDMKIEAVLGKVIYKQTASKLIDEGYLVKPIVSFIELPYVKVAENATYAEIYDKYIVLNDERNEKIKELALQEKDRGAVLILVEKVAHGELLNRMLPEATFTHGSLSAKERADIVERLNNREIPIIIATKIFDEGVDIRSLSTLILAGGGKSSIKVIQRTGRILRLFEGKDHARIYDFMDRTKHLFGHSKRRKLILEREPAFIIQ